MTHQTIGTLLPLHARQIDDNATQTVNARDLHSFLEVGKMFAHWIKNRIEQYDFVEEVDYITHLPKQASGENQAVTGFTPGILRKDYYLSLDMAKELAMVERTPKGKEARRYFIACEKQLRAQSLAGGQCSGPGTVQSGGSPFHEQADQNRLKANWNRSVAELAKSYSAIYVALGIRGPQRLLAVENAMREKENIEMGQIAPLPGPAQTSNNRYAAIIADRLISPTQIGQAIGKNARQVNLLLEDFGLQVREGKEWIPTPDAKGLYEWVETGKRHHSGAPVTCLRWRETAILEKFPH